MKKKTKYLLTQKLKQQFIIEKAIYNKLQCLTQLHFFQSFIATVKQKKQKKKLVSMV